MSGGDVGPLGDDAVNQLHSLFKWAESSRRGLLVFSLTSPRHFCLPEMQLSLKTPLYDMH